MHKEIGQYKLKTKEDMKVLRAEFKKKYDEKSFSSATDALKYLDKNPELADDLAVMLEDEEDNVKNWDKGIIGDEGEQKRRAYRVQFLIGKLGELKNNKSVQILRRMLKYKGTQYYASEALAAMGDTSANQEIKSLMEQGVPVNYGGLGMDAVKDLVKDLQDPNKKDKVDKTYLQLINIKNPEAKPYLKQLFNHESSGVRMRASSRFAFLADKNDIESILQMTKNNDWNIRTASIYAMQTLKDTDFSDILINMLNDTSNLVRSTAAHALGYKHVAKAVPYLEKALDDKENRVRERAFVSLYILTGKKYDYKGKDKRDDSIAEQEKQSPSFY
jgi:HEAT repeat protein